MSTIGALHLARLDLHIPPAGGWWADVSPVDGALPSVGDAATLTIGDLVLPGTVLRAGTDAPDQGRVTLAGGAGWATLLPAPGGAYASPSGVKLSTVLADLAGIAGEAYVAPADVSLGAEYGWDASTTTRPVRARAVLADLVQRGAVVTWRVAPVTGRTRFDAWPALGECSTLATTTTRDASLGVRTVALAEHVAAFLPGALHEGAVVRRVTMHEADNHLTAKVWER